MSDSVIRVNNISKRYQIGMTTKRHHGLKDLFSDGLKGLVRRNLTDRPKSETFWALKDICFEVKRGEVVGIIGRNGSGKSTLLKILSRITEPTSGQAIINGRVGSLLEVGTGFQPELTGRENIYLSGAILGMPKKEMDQKLDEIVAFSGVEKFIDTPVKRYSNGMYVRLGFAVAAHLEPEILLIDEVLAVGDVSFQKKCLGKMDEVSKGGRTVFFVSHSMPAIVRICHRAILLNEGQIMQDGSSHHVASVYLNSGVGTSANREWLDPTKAPGSEIVRLCAVRVKNEDGRMTDILDIREAICLEMEYEVLKAGHLLIPHFSVHNDDGLQLFSAVDGDPAWRGQHRPPGRYVSSGWIPGNFLAEGTVIVGAAANTLNPNVMHFYERDAVAFRVIDSFDGDSSRGEFPGILNGGVRPLLKWNTQYSPTCSPTMKIP
ncbi:MAG: ABC transporter ATP-binding protein [Nitrospiraceae bacterium]